MDLKGKAALVTGGNSGIGKAIALGLASQGAEVLIGSRRENLNRQAALEINKKTKSRVASVAADVSREEDCEMLISRTVELFGRIDICVNNAGIYTGSTIADLSTEDFDQVLKTNLYGSFWCSRAAFNAMRYNKPDPPDEIRGYIINISSVAGLDSWSGSGAYSISKFGIMALTRALADEGKKALIKVTAICPSTVATPMTGKKGADFIQPEDVAETVLYLMRLSPAAWPVPEVIKRRDAER